MKRFLRDNSLSLVLFGLFFVFLIGLSLTGFNQENQELAAHGKLAISFTQYLSSGSFIEAVFENWESEFLQMGAFVWLTIWFRQKGSKDSRRLSGKDAQDIPPRYSIIHASWRSKPRAIRKAIYSNSLTIGLFGLFFVSFALHAVGGVQAYNQEAAVHGQALMSTMQYVASARFWFESFQNWQSEFLSIGVLIVFTIFLRQRYSPESKPVGEPNTTTGK